MNNEFTSFGLFLIIWVAVHTVIADFVHLEPVMDLVATTAAAAIGFAIARWLSKRRKSN